jgi:hypothetical protein
MSAGNASTDVSVGYATKVVAAGIVSKSVSVRNASRDLFEGNATIDVSVRNTSKYLSVKMQRMHHQTIRTAPLQLVPH